MSTELFKRSSPARSLINKMESVDKSESVSYFGKKYSSEGDYVEELDLAVEDKDRKAFEKLLDGAYKKTRNTYDEPIAEVVNSLSKNDQETLIAELHKLHYDDMGE